MKARKVSGLMFDLGGVLIDNPVQNFINFFSSELGIFKDKINAVYKEVRFDYETGSLDKHTYWQAVGKKLGQEIYDSNLWSRALSISYVPRKEMFSLVNLFHKKGYKTCLASNAGKAASEYFRKDMKDYSGLFDEIVFSCDVGLNKPDPGFYEIALSKINLEPARCVFIDDSKEYVKAARKIGINGIVFENIGQLKSDLLTLGVK